jgi:hypothetical protein
MGDRDPVSWETRESALGSPAEEVEEYVDRLAADVRSEQPYVAVKAVHDALSEDLADEERSVPGLGEVFITVAARRPTPSGVGGSAQAQCDNPPTTAGPTPRYF